MDRTSSSATRRIAALSLGVLLAGCASSHQAKEAWPESERASRPRRFDPRAFAAQFSRPADCERAARELQVSSREMAWAGLKACIERGDFLLLRQLASPAWAYELQTRPDAPALLARVIAMRGGSINADLQLLHEQQIPLFTLNDGMSQPEVYKGRYVVFRARVGELRADGGSFTAKLEELVLRSEGWDVQAGVAHRSTSEARGAGSLQGRVAALGPGAGSGNLAVSHDKTTVQTIKRYDNITVETGREGLVRLPQADPFLAPGKEFIVLARFDGVRTTSNSADEDDPEVIPVMTLISFHPPSPLVVY